jgi:hypothetical protein
MVRDDEANPWTTLQVAERFRDDFITVEEHAVRDAAGRPSTYGIVRYRHRGLLVIPVHDDGSVTLIGQWRYAAGRYSWEFPAGSIERGEAPNEATKRELQEEARPGRRAVARALALTMSPAITDEHATALGAWDLRPAKRHPDPGEVLKCSAGRFPKWWPGCSRAGSPPLPRGRRC